VQALVVAGSELMAMQCQRIAVPKRFSLPMREIMQLQPRFARRTGKRVKTFLGHRRFRAAYDLYALRTLLGEVSEEELAWWTDAQLGVDVGQDGRRDDAQSDRGRKRAKKTGKKRPRKRSKKK